MDKIWLKQYPKGVAAEVDTAAYRSVKDVLEQSCAKFASKPAYENLGHTLSYNGLDRLTQRFASFLQNTLGLQKGDRVAVMMPNLLQYPVAIFGILRAGMVVVNVNPLYTPRELEHQLKDSGAKAIVIVENFIETLQKVIKETPVQHVITTQIGDLLPAPKRVLVNFMLKRVRKVVPKWRIPDTITFRRALARGQRPCAPVDLTQQDIAVLQYTGGTTGLAKGAMLTHGNLVANMQQAGPASAVAAGRTLLREGQEVMIAPLPLYHIYAFTANCMCMMVTRQPQRADHQSPGHRRLSSRS